MTDYDGQDVGNERREAMIEKLEDQLGQDTEVQDLFRIRWSVMRIFWRSGEG